MTIKQAKKILGSLADNIPDEEIEKEIKVAELLKTLYFNHNSGNNKAIYGKS